MDTPQASTPKGVENFEVISTEAVPIGPTTETANLLDGMQIEATLEQEATGSLPCSTTRPSGAQASQYYNRQVGEWASNIVARVINTGETLRISDPRVKLRTLQLRIYDGLKFWMDHVDKNFETLYRQVRVRRNEKRNCVEVMRTGGYMDLVTVTATTIVTDVEEWMDTAKEGEKCPHNGRTATVEEAKAINALINSKDNFVGGVRAGKVAIICFDRARAAAVAAAAAKGQQ